MVKDFTSPDRQGRSLAPALGEQALQSDYLVRRRIYGVTPSQITPFTLREVAVSNLELMTIKGIMLPSGAESGFYEVSSGSLRGFQFGKPSVSKNVDVELFDDEGGVSFLIHQQAENGKMPITQAEINRIVQSVRRVPASEAVR